MKISSFATVCAFGYLSSTTASRPSRASSGLQYENITSATCTGGMCLSGCNLVTPEKGKTKFFFDFDGTLERSDLLAHTLMYHLKNCGCGRICPNGVPDDIVARLEKAPCITKSQCPGGRDTEVYKKEQLIAALDEIRAACRSGNQTDDANFIATFFGAARWEALKTGMADLQAVGDVYIMSAAWNAISGTAWKGYLEKLSIDVLNLGIPKDNIHGIDDPGPEKASDKGTKIEELCKGKDDYCIHVDNSLKYVMQCVSKSTNKKHYTGGVYVETGTGVTSKTFELLKGGPKETCTVPTYTPNGGANWETDHWGDEPGDLTCEAYKALDPPCDVSGNGDGGEASKIKKIIEQGTITEDGQTSKFKSQCPWIGPFNADTTGKFSLNKAAWEGKHKRN